MLMKVESRLSATTTQEYAILVPSVPHQYAGSNVVPSVTLYFTAPNGVRRRTGQHTTWSMACQVVQVINLHLHQSGHLCQAHASEDRKSVFDSSKKKIWSNISRHESCTLQRMTARLKLGRPLEVYENEIFLFPRVCEVCGDAEPSKIMDCCKCHSVFYCSDEHRSADVERHERWCDIYDLCINCDVMEYRMGLGSIPFPICIDVKYKALSATIKEHLQSLIGFLSSNAAFEKNLLISLMSERLTYPLSLLYALEQVEIGPCKMNVGQISQLTVHVVGAESTKEMLGIIRWEYLAHILPCLLRLHVVFIGPAVFSESEINETLPDNHCLDDSGVTRCEDCQEKGKVIVYEMCQMLYHNYVTTSYYTNPDAIISFNCGFHEYHEEEKDTWPKSLQVMVQSKDVPLIFTSYTKKEAVNDFEVLEKVSEVEVIMARQLNPYQSLRPHRDPVKEDNADIFYVNQYITCVRGKK